MNLTLNRRITKKFIDELPVSLALVPRTRTKTPAGGFTWTEAAPRPLQTMTLIEPSVSPRPITTADGVERTIEFELLGQHDALLERYDVFTHDGKDWEIVMMFHDNGYEKRAMVSRRG